MKGTARGGMNGGGDFAFWGGNSQVLFVNGWSRRHQGLSVRVLGGREDIRRRPLLYYPPKVHY